MPTSSLAEKRFYNHANRNGYENRFQEPLLGYRNLRKMARRYYCRPFYYADCNYMFHRDRLRTIKCKIDNCPPKIISTIYSRNPQRYDTSDLADYIEKGNHRLLHNIAIINKNTEIEPPWVSNYRNNLRRVKYQIRKRINFYTFMENKVIQSRLDNVQPVISHIDHLKFYMRMEKEMNNKLKYPKSFGKCKHPMYSEAKYRIMIKKATQHNPGKLKNAPRWNVQGIRKCCDRKYFCTRNIKTVRLPSPRYIGYMKGHDLRIRCLEIRNSPRKRDIHQKRATMTCFEPDLTPRFDDPTSYVYEDGGEESAVTDLPNASIVKHRNETARSDTTQDHSKQLNKGNNKPFEGKSGLHALMDRIKTVKQINIMTNYDKEYKKRSKTPLQLTPIQKRTRECIKKATEMISTVDKIYGEYFAHVTVPEKFDPSEIKIKTTKHVNIDNDMYKELKLMDRLAVDTRKQLQIKNPSTNLTKPTYVRNTTNSIKTVNGVQRKPPHFYRKKKNVKGTPGISHYIKPLNRNKKPANKANEKLKTREFGLTTTVTEDTFLIESEEIEATMPKSCVPSVKNTTTIESKDQDTYDNDEVSTLQDGLDINEVNNINGVLTRDHIMEKIKKSESNNLEIDKVVNQKISENNTGEIDSLQYKEDAVNVLDSTGGVYLSGYTSPLMKSLSVNSLDCLTADSDSKLRMLKSANMPIPNSSEMSLQSLDSLLSLTNRAFSNSLDKKLNSLGTLNLATKKSSIDSDNLFQGKHSSDKNIDKVLNSQECLSSIINNECKGSKHRFLSNNSLENAFNHSSSDEINKSKSENKNINSNSNAVTSRNKISVNKGKSTKRKSLKDSHTKKSPIKLSNVDVKKKSSPKKTDIKKTQNNNKVITTRSYSKTHSNIKNSKPLKKTVPIPITNKSKHNCKVVANSNVDNKSLNKSSPNKMIQIKTSNKKNSHK